MGQSGFSLAFGAALTLQQFKILLAETLKGLVSWRKDCVGALLLQQVSQTGRLHQREENPAFIKYRKRREKPTYSEPSSVTIPKSMQKY